MTPFEPGADDTVRIQPPPRRKRGGLPYVIAVATLLVVSACGWLLWPVPSAPPSVSVSPAPASVPPVAATAVARPAFPIEIAT